MDLKKYNMHILRESFAPATPQEKEYMVPMRPSSTFFKDGVRRLLKDKVATASLVVLALIVLSTILLPMIWPYRYDQQLGLTIGRPTDPSYINLTPFTYGATERERMLGKATAQEIFISVPTDANESTVAAAKKQAEDIQAAFQNSGGTASDFAALQTYATPSAAETPLAITYTQGDGVGHKTFTAAAEEWIWAVKGGGKAVRIAGDTALLEGDSGYSLVYFSGYSGPTERVFPHVFGTDAAGRDYFIRVIYGARVSLAVGFFASMIVLVIGTTVGALAGYLGGKVDLVIMRIVDVIYSLPDMLMVILLAAAFKNSLGAWIEGTALQSVGGNIISLFIVFALLYWVSMARLVRGQILSLREQEYVLAAKAAGAKGSWIIRKHLLPNCIGQIVTTTFLQVPAAIFTESYLSFIGLGINAPMPSLGSLASDALNGISTYGYRLVIPAVMISLIVLSLNLFGDGLRDAFDPKLNR